MNRCRHCNAPLSLSMADLATAPPSNAYLEPGALSAPEAYYPLRVLVCTECWLVQTEDYAEADQLFDAEYAYFSSVSATWRAHCEAYVAKMIDYVPLRPESRVAEVAANDGCLLEFVQDRGIPCYGIEPTASTAAAAREKSIDIVEAFFGRGLGERLAAERSADLIAANNVLAHVPDINDFVGGFASLLRPEGVATFEFPHLERLLYECQFDTIYHEHYSYLSLIAVSRILTENGLTVFDAERLPTHGGSLRIFAQRSDTGGRAVTPAVAEIMDSEHSAGLDRAETYAAFQARCDRIKNDFLSFLLQAASEGKSVAGYGAAAKGNTLLNYAGVHGDLVGFVADRAESKQGKYLPGSRIPVVPEARIREEKPDYVVILPWNIAPEVVGQLSYIRDWGGQFVTAVPALKVF